MAYSSLVPACNHGLLAIICGISSIALGDLMLCLGQFVVSPGLGVATGAVIGLLIYWFLLDQDRRSIGDILSRCYSGVASSQIKRK